MKKSISIQLDKQFIAASFKASADTYDDNAIVQGEISRQLVNFLENFDSINYRRVLEIGCCTGILTDLLVEGRGIGTIYLNDLVEEFCLSAGARILTRVGEVEHLPGDIEQCSLPDNLDLVFSSATFQWMADLPGLLQKIHGALVKDGYLVFSIFGPGTMVEIGELTGRSLHYHSPERLSEMLQENFHINSLLRETRQIFFPTVRDVLKHIRQTGVGGIDRSARLPGRYKHFKSQYEARFASEKGLPVSYASTFVVARKK